MPSRSLASWLAFTIVVTAAGCSLLNAPDKVRPGGGEGGAGGDGGGWNGSASSSSASSSSSSASSSSSSSGGGGGMPNCGNGQVEPGETCDGNCPKSCDDAQACTVDTLNGSADACNAVCSNAPISACGSGDGCCPSGCGGQVDSDCCANPSGGPLAAENGTGTGVFYCYAPDDSVQTRASKACESRFGEGNCCVITGGYANMQYGECGKGGVDASTVHWHWDSHPGGDDCGPFYTVGEVLSHGWCGTIIGNFLD